MSSRHDACVFFRRSAWHVADEHVCCRSPTRGLGSNQWRQIRQGRFRGIPRALRHHHPVAHRAGNPGDAAFAAGRQPSVAGWTSSSASAAVAAHRRPPEAEWTTSG